MESDENNKRVIPHKDSNTQVGFWINKDVLAKWDNWAGEHGQSRTALIIEAVNNKIAGVQPTPVENEPNMDAIHATEKYLEGLKEELRQTVEQLRVENKNVVPDANLDLKIKTFLKIIAKASPNPDKVIGVRSDDIAVAIGEDRDAIVELMTAASEEYSMDPKGYWTVIKS